MLHKASQILFQRYLDVLEADHSASDPYSGRLSKENLIWMCQDALQNGDGFPIDKLSRWLGFVQGCLAMRGLIDVDEERDLSRPLFHAAYIEADIAPPASRSNDGSDA